MSKPYIQTLLRNANWTPHMLLSRYGIDFHRGTTHPNLVTFHYNPYMGIMDSKVVQQCRGLILDENNNWEVVARPFDKFFNWDDPLSAQIDWTDFRVEGKADGSLMIFYFYAGDWHVGTSGTPDAITRVNGLTKKTFRELFWDTYKAEGFRLPAASVQHLTFLFELTSPFNKQVVEYKTPRLTCLGVRHRMGFEIPAEDQDFFPHIQSYQFNNFDEIMASFSNIKPTDLEGYVVVDRYHKRIKVKHPEYFRLHRMKSSISLRKLTELVRIQEGGELKEALPEYGKAVMTLTEKVTRLANEIDANYWLLKDIKDRKEFASKAKTMPYSSVLFGLRDNHYEKAIQGLRLMHVDNLLRLVKVDEVELGEISPETPSVTECELAAKAPPGEVLASEIEIRDAWVRSEMIDLNDAPGG